MSDLHGVGGFFKNLKALLGGKAAMIRRQAEIFAGSTYPEVKDMFKQASGNAVYSAALEVCFIEDFRVHISEALETELQTLRIDDAHQRAAYALEHAISVALLKLPADEQVRVLTLQTTPSMHARMGLSPKEVLDSESCLAALKRAFKGSKWEADILEEPRQLLETPADEIEYE